MRVLNLGCGSDIRKDIDGEEWWNVDTNPPAYRSENARVLELDCRKIASYFEEGFFDRVFASFLFEHIEVAALPALLWNIHRVLAANGELLVHVPNMQAILREYERQFSGDTDENEEDKDPTFITMIVNPLRIFGDEQVTQHRSIWTPAVGQYYLEMEGLFRVVDVTQKCDPDWTVVYLARKV